MYDVIIIGAGPVGSYLAYRLSRAGYGVVVLERKERLEEEVCCAGIIGRECIDFFDIDDSVILRQVNSARLFSPSGRLIRLQRQETQACIVDRAAFDVAMYHRAQGAGVEYVFRCVVKDVEVGDDGVGVVATQNGTALNFAARVAVIAAGFGSPLAGRSGLARVGDFVIGAQAEVATTELDEIEVYFGQETAPGFFAWLVPTSPSQALVGLLSRRSPEHYLRKLMLSLLAAGKIISAETETRYRGISLKPLTKTYRDRVIVVGDAAGQVKATTGGGIYYGLLCAEIATDHLHRALESDDLSAKSLANYQREWQRKLGWELKICYWARKLYEHLSDQQIDRAFDIIESEGIDESLLRADDLSFDWHGEIILKLLRRRALSEALKVVKIPFNTGMN
ncbi:geranylgeranyl reductase family protein [Chloroflexota bacterium]